MADDFLMRLIRGLPVGTPQDPTQDVREFLSPTQAPQFGDPSFVGPPRPGRAAPGVNPNVSNRVLDLLSEIGPTDTGATAPQGLPEVFQGPIPQQSGVDPNAFTNVNEPFIEDFGPGGTGPRSAIGRILTSPGFSDFLTGFGRSLTTPGGNFGQAVSQGADASIAGRQQRTAAGQALEEAQSIRGLRTSQGAAADALANLRNAQTAGVGAGAGPGVVSPNKAFEISEAFGKGQDALGIIDQLIGQVSVDPVTGEEVVDPVGGIVGTLVSSPLLQTIKGGGIDPIAESLGLGGALSPQEQIEILTNELQALDPANIAGGRLTERVDKLQKRIIGSIRSPRKLKAALTDLRKLVESAQTTRQTGLRGTSVGTSATPRGVLSDEDFETALGNF